MKVQNISKNYIKNNKQILAINDFSYNFEKGNVYAIIGESGSGKTTLLNILGLMDNKDKGNYFFDGKEVDSLTNNEKAKIRMEKIGFVFQEFYLDENLTAVENVMLPMIINKKIESNQRKIIALDLLERFKVKERANHFPKELSGGEKQRVCIARALANNPDYILCDEPTGDLDKDNEEEVFKYLYNLKNDNKCVIIVSHSEKVKEYSDKIIKLDRGNII